MFNFYDNININSIVKLPNNDKITIYLMTLVNKNNYKNYIKLVEEVIGIDNLFDLCTKYPSWKLKYTENNMVLNIKIKSFEIYKNKDWKNIIENIIEDDNDITDYIKFYYKTSNDFEPYLKKDNFDNSYYLIRGLMSSEQLLKYLETNKEIEYNSTSSSLCSEYKYNDF